MWEPQASSPSSSLTASTASARCSPRSPTAAAARTSCSTPPGRTCRRELRPLAAVTLAAHLDKLDEEGRLPEGVQRPAWRSVAMIARSRYRSLSMPPRSPSSSSPPQIDCLALRHGRPATRRARARRCPTRRSPDRRLRLPVGLPHRRAAGLGRLDRVDVPAALRLAVVFASMLDRGAGSFRVGPYGLYVPAGRRYIPGTNLIETTWMTPQGWLRVVDALTIGDWHDNKHGSSHTRPPTDYDADHLLVRMLECIQGQVQVEMICEPMLDYGATPAQWSVVDTGERGRLRAGRERRRDRGAPVQRHAHGHRGQQRARAPHDGRGRAALLRALLDEELRGPRTVEQARSTWTHQPLLALVAGRRQLSRPPLALSPAALRAHAEGTHVHADGRARGRAHDIAAGDAARRAQLGLPLLLDARRLVHALGAARARAGLGGRRLHPVRRRHASQRGRLAADHVRHQRPEGPRGVHARPPQGLRGRAPGADRQRRLHPAPERRLWRGARLGLPALKAPRSHPRPSVAGARRPGPAARRGSGRSPTRGSGRRAASLATTSPRS